MDPIKEAFLKIKEDIRLLNKEIQNIKEIIYLQNQAPTYIENENKTNDINQQIQTQQKFDRQTDTDSQNVYLEPLYSNKMENSTGNKGVSTDRQTLTQTHRQTGDVVSSVNQEDSGILPRLNRMRENMKKMARSLTSQELSVLCKIYELDKTNTPITYSSLSTGLNLTESSIRDYITRLLSKGAPIEKRKINNKQIQIILTEEVKTIIPLTALIALRNEGIRYND